MRHPFDLKRPENTWFLSAMFITFITATRDSPDRRNTINRKHRRHLLHQEIRQRPHRRQLILPIRHECRQLRIAACPIGYTRITRPSASSSLQT